MLLSVCTDYSYAFLCHRTTTVRTANAPRKLKDFFGDSVSINLSPIMKSNFACFDRLKK
jgi:hypothetical protein